MKQKPNQVSPSKLYASLIKRKSEQEQRLKSPVINPSKYLTPPYSFSRFLVPHNRNQTGALKIEAKKPRPASGKDLKEVSSILLKKTHAR